jgi:hypothetical protein
MAIPAVIELSSYPNPFNSSITIQYSLSESSPISIEIYDVLGRRIKRLSQGLQHPGVYQVIWDADLLSSGVYFYRIQGEDYSDTGKMLLLK